MFRGTSSSKPELLLGGKYSQFYLNLFNELNYTHTVHSLHGKQDRGKPKPYDYAVIDNRVLEEMGEGFIDALIAENENIYIIVREVPYRDWKPKVYDADGLAQLQATYPSNVTFPDRSYMNDTVIEKLEELVQT